MGQCAKGLAEAGMADSVVTVVPLYEGPGYCIEAFHAIMCHCLGTQCRHRAGLLLQSCLVILSLLSVQQSNGYFGIGCGMPLRAIGGLTAVFHITCQGLQAWSSCRGPWQVTGQGACRGRRLLDTTVNEALAV